MEALGSVSSVIAVVQIAGSLAKLCSDNSSDLKDPRYDIERLQQKAATLRDVLQIMAEANDRRNPKSLNLSAKLALRFVVFLRIVITCAHKKSLPA
jgi:hypothetical protein